MTRLPRLLLPFLLILLAPLANAETVAFEGPATFEVESSEVQSDGILLVFRPGTEWSLTARSDAVDQFLRHTYANTEGSGVGPVQLEVPSQPEDADWRTLRLTPMEGRASSLFIRADAIQGGSAGTKAILREGDFSVQSQWGDPWWERVVRGDVGLGDEPIFEPASANDAFTFTDLRSMEWTNARSACEGGATCPQADESDYVIDHIEQFLSNGQATLTGTPDFVAFLGPLDLNLEGTARLPKAAGQLDCDNCTVEGDTLVVHGTLNFTDLRSEQGGFTTDLTGTYSVRINESPKGLVSPQSATVAAVAAVGLIVLLKLIWPLISKQILSKPLEQETRRVIFEAVEANPAVTQRELGRITEVANGTLMHHLMTLEKAGQVRSWSRGGKRHYAVASLTRQQALRHRAEEDGDLMALRAFVRASGEVTQTRLTEWAKDAFGWARSTAQAKVAFLCEVGLVEAAPLEAKVRGRRYRAA